MKKNTIITISIMVMLVSALCITGIFAYLTARDFANNTLSAGNSEIVINEAFRNPDIEPNEVTEITKQVKVENTGINCSAVRVRVEFSEKGVLSWVTADYDAENWTKDGDYYYYNQPLESGSETPPLFNKLTCNNPSASQVKNFDVYVYAESRVCESSATLPEIKALYD